MKKLAIGWRDGIRQLPTLNTTELKEPTPQPQEVGEVEEQTEVGEQHDQLEEFEIVEPPETEQPDQMVAHGGDDVTAEVEDAPEREDAEGEEVEGQETVSSQEADSEDAEDDEAEVPDWDWRTPEEKQLAAEKDRQAREEKASEEEQKKASREAFQLAEAYTIRRLQNTFATIVGKVAEDLSGLPTVGDEFWDVQELMLRKISKRNLQQCRMSIERERILLILDTSGSCSHMAGLFAQISHAAEKLGSVEIYAAPNADISCKIVGRRAVQTDLTDWWNLKGRTILFFGDFDGGDALVVASKKNKVYWFSCENRYEDMDEHSWCNYELDDFNGSYNTCYTVEDIMHISKRIR